MLRENGGREASALLEKWTGKQPFDEGAAWDVAMAGWQAWFAETYPDLPEATLPKEPEQSHWAYQELLSFLTGPQHATGNAGRGATVFEKAHCAKCHRFGERGDIVGPDLTTVARRFQRKEILESILFPSQVVSDQYATQMIATTDGRTIVGMVSPVGDGSLIVLQGNGEKLKITKEEIEQATRAKQSAMPDGLLNALTLEEVADLFAYLTKTPTIETAAKPASAETVDPPPAKAAKKPAGAQR
jgi:putative heme-binding domain-containing protein